MTVDQTVPHFDKAELGQIVLVLQGGGALGAYQAGVYEALDEAGVEPDWVIGTSIGAINAGIIAGNRPGRPPAAQLREFWQRIAHRGPTATWFGDMPMFGAMAMSNSDDDDDRWCRGLLQAPIPSPVSAHGNRSRRRRLLFGGAARAKTLGERDRHGSC